MTDTTDKLTLQQLKDVRELCLPHTAWRLIIDELISARDRLEAERQRADAADSRLHEVSVHCANVEAELAALKGEQVPVAKIIKTWPPTTGRKFIDYYSENIQHLPVGTELFTAPQKPVGLRQIGSIDHDGGEFAEYFVEFTDSAQVGQVVYVIGAAIEAAGGIVKEGE